MERLQSSCLHLSRVLYLTSIGQKGKNSCDVDSHFLLMLMFLFFQMLLSWLKAPVAFPIRTLIFGSIQIARPVREQLFARTVVARSYDQS